MNIKAENTNILIKFIFFSWGIRVFLEAIEKVQNKTLTPTVIIEICWVFVFVFVVYTNVEPPFFYFCCEIWVNCFRILFIFLILYFPTSALCAFHTIFLLTNIWEFFFYITIFLERNKLSISPSAHIKNNFHNLIMHNKLRQKENNSGRNVQNAIYEVYITRFYIRLYCNCM